jgi:DNA-binding LacI/PurR family transcriptional regulator/DNA-binding transcriptional regulator YhcF (GntR family)
VKHGSEQIGANRDRPLKSLLPERVRDAIRSDIQRGRWSGQLPSERRLAQEFQISRPTVHTALCALQAEGLVRARSGEAWYIIQRSTDKPRTTVRRAEVALVRYAKMWPDMTSLLPLTDSLRQKLHRLGYGLLLADASVHGAKGLEKTLGKIDAEYQPSFYLLSSVPPEVHRWFERRETPAIVLGSRLPDVRLPAIEFDPETTFRHAVQYLLRRGHRRIALLNVPLASTGTERVNHSFLKTCADWRDGEVQGVIHNTVARPPSIESAVRRMLGHTRPPTAVIAPHLDFVIGMYSVAGELGFHIPRDVSVLSTCYWPVLDCLRPVPTCYIFSWENMASRVARLISNYLRLGVWPTTFWNLQPTLREGDSVATLPKS